MTIYVSGPMTGLPEFNHPAFIAAKARLEEEGHRVISPHEAPPLSSWNAYMRHDIGLLLQCDAIYRLSGWQRSVGALVELVVAWAIGCTIMDERL